jgi:hypothetical protein
MAVIQVSLLEARAQLLNTVKNIHSLSMQLRCNRGKNCFTAAQ